MLETQFQNGLRNNPLGLATSRSFLLEYVYIGTQALAIERTKCLCVCMQSVFNLALHCKTAKKETADVEGKAQRMLEILTSGASAWDHFSNQTEKHETRRFLFKMTTSVKSAQISKSDREKAWAYPAPMTLHGLPEIASPTRGYSPEQLSLFGS